MGGGGHVVIRIFIPTNDALAGGHTLYEPKTVETTRTVIGSVASKLIRNPESNSFTVNDQAVLF